MLTNSDRRVELRKASLVACLELSGATGDEAIRLAGESSQLPRPGVTRRELLEARKVLYRDLILNLARDAAIREGK